MRKKKSLSNSYKYIDSKHIYIDPKTDLLRNLLDITDEETLLFSESGAVTKRLQELYQKPIYIEDTKKSFQNPQVFISRYLLLGRRKKDWLRLAKMGNNFFR